MNSTFLSASMKNAKLSSKFLFLTIILLAVSVFIAWVGISRLRTLNAKVEQLGSRTMQNAVTAGTIRTRLLLAIRSQKNSILATTTADSIREAELSRKHFSDINRETRLLSTLASGAEKALFDEFEVALEEFRKMNESCLEMSVLNTNIAAKAELYGRAADALSRILSTLKTSALTIKSKAPADSGRDETLESIREFTDLTHEIFRIAAQHIDTSAGESRFTEIDQRLREMLEMLPRNSERVQESIQTAGIPANDLSAAATALRSSIAEILRLSTIDSNNKSVEMSLAGRQKTDAAIASIDELVGLLTAAAERDVAESGNIYSQGLMFIVATCVAGLLLGFWASFSISKSITQPITMVRDVTRDMATGDLESRIQLSQQDEVGELACATDALADALTAIIVEIQKTSVVLAESSSNLGEISGGLAGQSEETSLRSSSVAAAAEELSTNINTMSAAAEQMSMNFSSISSATEELSVSVGAISSAAEQTSSNVTNVSGAVQSISSSFGDVLRDVKEGARIAGDASQMADTAGRTMRDLDQSSSEISKFTETIKMIALQTNLLALNATIEATSAGEAGKGFAVVAHEIKELANQSAKAAEDIARKIEGVQSGTRQAVGVIREIADVIRNINQSADRISMSVENQNVSAQTISRNIAEANQGVGHIARSISEVASTANLMARNIAEASRGAVDVSRNVGEAARASSGISQSISRVSAAAKETNSSAAGVTEAAKQLDQIAAELRNLISKFKISRNGNA